ncbi:hypothetical protein [Defluviimonas denitrificans]|jgi:hypothetical protein|uniref:hypothetical protein n=1 Tax=Albidovulum denitrificans TaxID=404881 RepID=UPI0011B047AB|nr:hypothetical protein [Defluviimonas denitrificans]
MVKRAALPAEAEQTVPDGVENKEVYRVAVKVLSGTSEAEPMSSSVLVDKVSEGLQEPLVGYLIYRALLQATHPADSLIKSRKGRRGGYFLGEPESFNGSDGTVPIETKKEKTLEKHLWPVVVDWLRLNKPVERISSDIANRKSGGVWSNPDIVGLNIVEELGFFDVEITTLEVKTSLSNWRYFFFEAVSHKRISERVYFVYRSRSDIANELKSELLRYAEKYGVGLIELQMDDGEYDALTASTSSWNKRSVDLPGFCGERLAHFTGLSLEGDGALVAER